MNGDLELKACQLDPVSLEHFNPAAEIPYGLTIEQVRQAMNEFLDFLCFINTQLHSRSIPRLETMIMPANFSSIVGEFMHVAIPKYCGSVVENHHHNGHPDLLPAGRFPNDAAQHAAEGIEIKGSRYLRGWQGHNPEDTWLMVFVYDSNNPSAKQKTPIRPFRFRMVVGAPLTKDDWAFSGRKTGSRRTITASVMKRGYERMIQNWIYLAP